jgi:hypothetical protein
MIPEKLAFPSVPGKASLCVQSRAKRGIPTAFLLFFRATEKPDVETRVPRLTAHRKPEFRKFF